MEKQGGMAFGFWKTATAVIEPDRLIVHMNVKDVSPTCFGASVLSSGPKCAGSKALACDKLLFTGFYNL
jgi:hypothetical protein